ncbi:MAG: winged helix-turn-helix domain-containing protein [Candidatus Thermoplasmatota archaeon]|nr:winged helix-turn-helix domain-containing protein [Candidatus Thermoplasmatota archaeon]
MSTIVEEFGQNAGKVWQALYDKGPLSESKLINTTYLDEHQLRTAVGWLARENKICRNGTVYKIGGTNLVGKIGVDAGKVWTVLSKKQTDVDISSLARLTKIDSKDVYAAIGWLARENKIDAKQVMKKKTKQLKVSLK